MSVRPTEDELEYLTRDQTDLDQEKYDFITNNN